MITPPNLIGTIAFAVMALLAIINLILFLTDEERTRTARLLLSFGVVLAAGVGIGAFLTVVMLEPIVTEMVRKELLP